MTGISRAAGQTLVALGLLLAGAQAMAIEEPAFDVVQEGKDYELRRYDSYLVAETDISGDPDKADGKAFRILAGYIFGDNTTAEKMNMTAPVESRPAGEGTKMAMTAPVISGTGDAQSSKQTYAFVMESKYTMETLPTPNDARVRLREIKPRTMAVRRFSGFWSASNFEENTAELLEALADNGVTVLGSPVIARYNGPITPWFLRRNEVMVEVEWPDDDGVRVSTSRQ